MTHLGWAFAPAFAPLRRRATRMPRMAGRAVEGAAAAGCAGGDAAGGGGLRGNGRAGLGRLGGLGGDGLGGLLAALALGGFAEEV